MKDFKIPFAAISFLLVQLGGAVWFAIDKPKNERLVGRKTGKAIALVKKWLRENALSQLGEEEVVVEMKKWVDGDYDRGYVLFRERGEGRWLRVLESDRSGKWAATEHGGALPGFAADAAVAEINAIA